jgi:general secretion pathway protein D
MVCVGNESRSCKSVRRACSFLLALCATALLTCCNYATVGTNGSIAPADIDVLDKVRSVDIMPRQTQQVANAQNNAGQRGRAAVFEGTEIAEVGDVPTPQQSAGGGYDLNFESTPIATVAKVIA